jgi:hypothetical protein
VMNLELSLLDYKPAIRRFECRKASHIKGLGEMC